MNLYVIAIIATLVPAIAYENVVVAIVILVGVIAYKVVRESYK
jgi:hypothetical protein